MPRMKDSTMTQDAFDDAYAPRAVTPAEGADQLIPVPNEMARSPVMIASLPGSTRSPDAILRQHLGGRTSSGGRFL